MNPADEWEHQPVPELRIVDPELWESVRRRQAECRLEPATDVGTLNGTHRRKFVLSGLLRCASCDGAYAVMAKGRYGCASHTKSGLCPNGRTISRAALEGRVLGALQEKMLSPNLMAAFIVAYNEEIKAARAAEVRRSSALKVELGEIARKISGIIDAIEQGAWSASLQERLSGLEDHQRAITAQGLKEAVTSNVVAIRPATESLSRSRVADLVAALADTEAQAEAAEALRKLIDRIVLTPDDTARDRHHIDLYGDLAAALAIAHSSVDKSGSRDDRTAGLSVRRSSQVSVVAGTGFEPVTFRL